MAIFAKKKTLYMYRLGLQGLVMNNLHYDFNNTGYKIHLPVVPDSNEQLTRKIADYLDNKFGLQQNTNKEYRTPYYKVGSGGELEGGKGITLYGKTGSMQEMQELAQEIEQKFGKELANNVQKYNIGFEDPIKLSNSVQARFAVYHHGYKIPNTNGGYNIQQTLQVYCNGNPSGAIPTRICTTIDGTKHGFSRIKGLSEIDKKFWHGDSTMYALDNFGELFTGKIENGKVPQFIMDGLPKEYLQHYNLTEKDIIARINNGTKQIVANMLEDVANNPNSKILAGNPPWFTTLDAKVVDEAKQLLAQYEPQTVQKLEHILPQLEQKCPALSVLKQTTPFSQMKMTPVQKGSTTNPFNSGNPVSQATNPVNPTANTHNPVGTQNPVQSTPKPQSSPKPNTNVGGNTPKVGWFEKLGTKGKIGVVVAGTALVAGSIYALAHQNTPKKNEVKTVGALETQLSQQTQPVKTYQNPYNTNFCGYYNNPYYNYQTNELMRI